MKRRWPHVAVFLLIAALAAEMFLGDIDIGPFSPRVYLYLTLLATLVFRMVVAGDVLPIDRWAVLLLSLYALFLGWSSISLWLQGGSLLGIAAKLASYDAIAVIGFLLMLFFVRTRADLQWLVGGLVFLIATSAAVAVLQAAQIPQAWALWARLRPQVFTVAGELGVVILETGPTRTYPPGLYASTFAFGYFLASGVVIALAFLLIRRNLVRLTALLMLAAALLIIQQRSALLAIGVTCGLFALRLFERGKRLKVIAAALVVAVIAGAIVVALLIRVQEGDARAGRYLNLLDRGRLEVGVMALKFIVHHPLVGGPDAYVEFFARNSHAGMHYDHIVAPHNLFLNAGVYYGVPGVLLSVMLVAAVLLILLRVWRIAVARKDLLAMGVVLSVVGYLVNAQFHNASFVTGDSLPWWLIAFVLLAERFPAADAAVARPPRRTVLSSPRPTAGTRLSPGVL
ncbi:MAG TPA: O-antigen ligase family protein [Thermoanaerobaculia bacterium]|jgi:hypothetical protein